MTHHLDQALGLLFLAYLAHRSRSVPSLRPAARAVAAFVALDVARFATDVAGSEGWRGWVDCVAFVVMPGCWAGLLALHPPEPVDPSDVRVVPMDPPRGPDRRREREQRDETMAYWHDTSGVPDDVRHLRSEKGLHRRHAPIIHALLLSCYALLLLLARHHPAVASHWTALLQTPRLVIGAAALLVALRSRGPLPPSVSIGCALALSAAASVVGGLWAGEWWAVRVVSAAGWGAAWLVARRAGKSTGGPEDGLD